MSGSYSNMSGYFNAIGDSAFCKDKTNKDFFPSSYKSACEGSSTFDTSMPGFGYCNSDLKNPYISREQLNSRLIAPSINPANYRIQK